MRGIVIDPWTRTISEVDIGKDYKEIHRALSNEHVTVDCMCNVVLADFNGVQVLLWLDDEGLLKENTPVFYVTGYPEPLAGRGLILDCDREGESIGTRIGLAGVRKVVQWSDKLTTGDMGPSTQTVEVVPMLGDEPIPVIRGGSAILKDKEEN